jgi:hypothetical protein
MGMGEPSQASTTTDPTPVAQSHITLTEAEETVLSLVHVRNDFYRFMHAELIKVALLGILILFLLFYVFIHYTRSENIYWYIPSSMDGSVLVRSSILKPEVNGDKIEEAWVKEWAQKAISRVYNFDFMNYTGSFRNMIFLFTPEGYKAYRKALEKTSKILPGIIEQKQVVLAAGCGVDTVEILKAGPRDVQGYPVYGWDLKMPLVARYMGTDSGRVMFGTLIMRLHRVPELMSEDGVGIYGFVITDPINVDNVGLDVSEEKLCSSYLANFYGTGGS